MISLCGWQPIVILILLVCCGFWRRNGAIAATVLGILGNIYAVVFPVRFKLPVGPAIVHLALLGLASFIVGIVALVSLKRSQEVKSAKAWALFGVASGAILAACSLLLSLGPISRRYETHRATALLESVSGQERDWNYGNVIHGANLILGRVALDNGNIEEAKHYLLESGKTPGSPQLNSFGPDMKLAEELLEKGERKVVLEYFDLCRKFWGNTNRNDSGLPPGSAANSQRVDADNARKLAQWQKEIQEGKKPDFGVQTRGWIDR